MRSTAISAKLPNLVGPAREELGWMLRAARARPIRSIRQFAEEELVIPEGKYAGRRWRASRQPYQGLLLDALGSGQWRRYVILGPVQSGKSLMGFVLPLMYHLFEVRETTIGGIPTLDLSHDKWSEELLPAIRRSRYRDLLPSDGAGSRGGLKVDEIHFRHGVTLKFMSGSGGDVHHSSFTARVAAVTEVDKMDRPTAVSREADPIVQIENRTASYPEAERVVYLESTVSIQEGRIWQEYQLGTASRIVCPCPRCRRFVTPEREHLMGWQQAESKEEARQKAFFVCPDCGQAISEGERRWMNQEARLLHRGQEITPEGQIVGEAAATDTLGFRWGAFNNLFWTPGELGAKEWQALRAHDEENAKKELLQFCWATPYEPPRWETTPLTSEALERRMGQERRGFLPAGTKWLTMQIDPGKRVGWWLLLATREDGSSHIPDYGSFEIPSDNLGLERALLAALRDLRDEMVLKGWPIQNDQPPMTNDQLNIGAPSLKIPDQVWIDAKYQTAADVVYGFVRECNAAGGAMGGNRFRPAMGCGFGQLYARTYSRPTKTGGRIKHVGEQYHVVWIAEASVWLMEVDADYWKARAQERLAMPSGEPGAITLYYSPDKREHISLAKQLTAERQIEEFVPGRGNVHKWIRQYRQNHFLDCLYNCLAAAHLCGARVAKTDPSRARDQGPETSGHGPGNTAGLRMPDGQPYLVTQRR